MKWLYKITNLISGKEYIGVTIDPDRRWRQHQIRRTQCSALKDAMVKYGVDNFSFKVLCCGEDSYIDDLEMKAISLYNTQVPNGYNITLGGDGAVLYEWCDSWNKLLGTKTDKELAEDLGLTYSVIQTRRNGLGIKSFSEKNRISWEGVDDLLGKDYDYNISDEFGISTSSISIRRKELGIPLYSEDTEHYFNEEVITLLGNKSDPYIAENYNIPLFAVKNKRRSMDIEGAKQGSWVHKRDWTDRELDKVRDTSLTTAAVSELLNISRNTVQKKRKELKVKFDRKYKTIKYPVTEEMKLDLLNENMSTKDIASKYSMDWTTAKRKREKVLEEELYNGKKK